MKTLEELKADHEAARNEWWAADKRQRETLAALEAGYLAASGLAGHKVSYSEPRGWGRTQHILTTTFLVQRVVGEGPHARLYGKNILANGYLGKFTKTANRALVTDHGPWEAAK